MNRQLPSWALAAHLVPGYRFGRYELVSLLGEGGFASVWLAYQKTASGTAQVAVKIMRPDRAQDWRSRAMFLDEATIVRGLVHPNVARTFEVGEDRALTYMVMEYIAGISLDRLNLSGVAIPIEALVRVLADACRGLHFAHEQTQDGKPLNIVHRDVSPQNILLREDGTTKVIDFGIAKATARIAPETTTGFTKGKLSYMSPEQALADEVDRRADVWAVGAVAYHLLEGRTWNHGPNDAAHVAALIGTRPVPPLGSHVPKAIAAVIAKALQRNVEERYPTAAALGDALEEAFVSIEQRPASQESVRDLVASVLAIAPSRASTAGERALPFVLPEAAEDSGIATDDYQPPSRKRVSNSKIALFIGGTLLAILGLAFVLRTRATPLAASAPAVMSAAAPSASVAAVTSSAPMESASSPTAARPSTPVSSRPAKPAAKIPHARPPAPHRRPSDDDAIQ